MHSAADTSAPGNHLPLQECPYEEVMTAKKPKLQVSPGLGVRSETSEGVCSKHDSLQSTLLQPSLSGLLSLWFGLSVTQLGHFLSTLCKQGVTDPR